MKEQIIKHRRNPRELEMLYRKDKVSFKRDFTDVYPKYRDEEIMNAWFERLEYEEGGISWGKKNEIILIISLTILAGLYAKLPDILSIDEEFFYPRNLGFLLFPFLAAFFSWKNRLDQRKTAFLLIVFIISLIYINYLPRAIYSDTLTLACLHLPLLLWGLFGISYLGGDLRALDKRLEYLKFNGELIIMSGLLFLAAALTSAITIGLFEIINIDIEEIYFRYIAISLLPAIPIIGTYIAYHNPQLVGKISPLIARIFSPIALIILTVYTATILISGRELYQDRDFLVLFNIVLIAVLALIFFSIAESHNKGMPKATKWILFLLSLITILVNGIALAAILIRISEWGMTPNRLAVLGANVLIFLNLLSVGAGIFKAIKNETEILVAGRRIAVYLPVYLIWAAVVIFLFPLIFNFV